MLRFVPAASILGKEEARRTMNDIEEAVIPMAIRLKWIEACRKRLPYEACGIVFGRVDGNRLNVEGFAIVRNAAPDPSKAFFFEPDDWVRAWYDAERSGKRIVGIFHSHPGGTARPSATDTDQRPDWGAYWIIGLASGQDALMEAYRAEQAGGWRRLTQLVER